MQITQVISALTFLPSLGQAQATFDANFDGHINGDLPTMISQLNTFGVQVNGVINAINAAISGGAFAMDYAFSTNTADADPGAGHCRFNNATQTATTVVRLQETDANGLNIAGLLALLDDSTSDHKGYLVARKASDGNKLIVFNVWSATDAGAYWNVGVSVAAYSGLNPYVNDDALTFGFVRTGDKGATPWTPPAAWAPATAYTTALPASCVVYAGECYVCTTAHTSGGAFDATKFIKIAAAGSLSGVAAGTVDFLTGSSIASASTLNLDLATGNRVHVTGTNAITAVTLTRGPRTVIFDGVLTLTVNGLTVTTQAGDVAAFEGDGSSVFLSSYVRKDGTALVGAGVPTLGAMGTATVLGAIAQGNVDTDAIQLSNDVVIVGYANASGYPTVRCVTAGGATLGTALVLEASAPASNIVRVNLAKLDATHFLASWRSVANSSNSVVAVATLSGTTITVGTAVSTGYNGSPSMGMCAMSANLGAIAIGGSGGGPVYFLVIQVSGSTVTLGSAQSLTGSFWGDTETVLGCMATSATTFIIHYHPASSNATHYAVAVTTSAGAYSSKSAAPGDAAGWGSQSSIRQFSPNFAGDGSICAGRSSSSSGSIVREFYQSATNVVNGSRNFNDVEFGFGRDDLRVTQISATTALACMQNGIVVLKKNGASWMASSSLPTGIADTAVGALIRLSSTKFLIIYIASSYATFNTIDAGTVS